MKRWLVTVPVVGAITLEVDADTEEGAINEAIEHAFDDVEVSGIGELNAYPKIVSGNCLHVPINEAIVKEMIEEES